MNQKGISPLIAAVMLIFITMVIAGIMATWASGLVRTETDQMNCIGALTIDTPTFSGSTVTVKIRNTHDKLSLEGIKVYLEYSDTAMNTEYTASDHGVSDPLGPVSIDWFTVDTGHTTEPVRVEVVALNCPRSPASANF